MNNMLTLKNLIIRRGGVTVLNISRQVYTSFNHGRSIKTG